MRGLLSALVLWLALAVLAPPAAASSMVTPIPRPSYLAASTDIPFVRVNGQLVPVAQGEGGTSNGITYDFARFTMSGPVAVEITAREPITTASVLPDIFGLATRTSGASLFVTLDTPRYVVVQINALRKLILLADAPETLPNLTDPLVKSITTVSGIDPTGATLNTSQIQSAINALPTGGTLYFPAGEYLFTQVTLKSNMTLYLAAGAVLKGSTTPGNYSWFTLPGGSTQIGYGHVQIWDATNVAIRGLGTIDGRQTRYASERGSYRQAIIQMIRATDVEIDGVTALNSGFWNVTPRYSDDIQVNRLKILGIENWEWADGFDVVSSTDVVFDNGFVLSGDDAFSPKGQGNLRAVIFPKPITETRNVIHRNSVIYSGDANGIRIGDEILDPISDVTFSNIQVVSAQSIGLLLSSGDGNAAVNNIRFENVTVYNTGGSAITMSAADAEADGLSASFANIVFDNVAIVPTARSYSLRGFSPSNPVNGLTFKNLRVGSTFIGSQAALDAANGSPSVTVSNVTGLTFPLTQDVGPRFEAEGFDSQRTGAGLGVGTTSGDGGTVVNNYSDGDALTFDSVNFGTGSSSLTLRRASATTANVDFQLRLGGPDGTLLGQAGNGLRTGGWSTYGTISTPITRLTGYQKVTLLNAGGGLILNWFETPAEPAARRYEAESRTSTTGAVTVLSEDGGSTVGEFADGDALTFNAVDFGSGRATLVLRVSSATTMPIAIEVRLGGPTGTVIGTAGDESNSGGWTTYRDIALPLVRQAGPQTITIRSAQGGIRLNWFELGL